MDSNADVQAALVAYLKSKTVLVSELSTTEDIKEDQWQGTEFIYPAVRVRIISSIPKEVNCDWWEITLGIQVFSEQASSEEADEIAGIINTVLHNKGFTSQSLHFYLRTTNLVPAIRSDTRTWRSEVLMSGMVSG